MSARGRRIAVVALSLIVLDHAFVGLHMWMNDPHTFRAAALSQYGLIILMASQIFEQNFQVETPHHSTRPFSAL